MKLCPHCRDSNPDNAIYCGSCRFVFPQVVNTSIGDPTIGRILLSLGFTSTFPQPVATTPSSSTSCLEVIVQGVIGFIALILIMAACGFLVGVLSLAFGF